MIDLTTKLSRGDRIQVHGVFGTWRIISVIPDEAVCEREEISASGRVVTGFIRPDTTFKVVTPPKEGTPVA